MLTFLAVGTKFRIISPDLKMNFHASQDLLSCPFLGSIEEKKDSCEVEWSFSILDVTSQVSRPSDCYLWRIPQTNFCMRSEHRPFLPKAQPNVPNSDSDSLPVRSPKSIIGLLDLETVRYECLHENLVRVQISLINNTLQYRRNTSNRLFLLHSFTEVEAICFSFRRSSIILMVQPHRMLQILFSPREMLT
jgi:hypothetical protein